MTKRDLCTSALREIGVVDPVDTPSDEDMDIASEKFDLLLDGWNGQRNAVYADVFATSVLTPSLSPHTIGPTGTFVVTQRPVSLEAAGLVITGGSYDIRRSITVRDAAWWAGVTVKALSTPIPTDVYYEPDWPNGKLFFAPVPSTAYSVELQTRMLLAALAIDDAFTMPPGYNEAVVLSVAEKLCRPFAKPLTPDLAADAARARSRVFSNNRVIPRIQTQDWGMPQGGAGVKTFIPESREM